MIKPLRFQSPGSVHSEPLGIARVVDFTSGQAVYPLDGKDAKKYSRDDYGHGTHVAAMIASQGNYSNGRFRGVAPEVTLLDLRVLGSNGTGSTSHLISAIDWVIANRETYDIRAANLSLGHPPVDSYRDDPLCQAVEQMVEAGIVTVVSAGNLGKSANYPKIVGAITSPGNDPSVITVGAINIKGTTSHSDDVPTTYSSRGPTYLDNLFKPDLSAPGNQVGSLTAKGSLLHEEYVTLDPVIRLAAQPAKKSKQSEHELL